MAPCRNQNSTGQQTQSLQEFSDYNKITSNYGSDTQLKSSFYDNSINVEELKSTSTSSSSSSSFPALITAFSTTDLTQRVEQQQLGNMSPMQTSTSNNNINNNNNNNNNHNHNNNNNNNNNNGNTVNTSNALTQHNLNSNINVDQFTQCCYPNGDCCKLDTSLIYLSDLSDCVKVLCNNENCSVGQYMHKECFESWEQQIMVSLKNMGGRARSWSDRQKVQNMWTKKGYDLIYKLCNCKCSRGHLRKDLEWTAPKALSFGNGQRLLNGAGSSVNDDDDKKNKSNNSNNKKKRKNNQKNTSNQQSQQQTQQQQANSITINGGSNISNNSLECGGQNNLMPAPNVGVIGSGLPQNQHQQQQSSITANDANTDMPANMVTSLNTILLNSHINTNASNILGLDIRPTRTNSISSGSNNSGSSSPSAISTYSSGIGSGGINTINADLTLCSPIQQQPQQQQQQQQHNLMQSSVASPLTKTILSGLSNLHNSVLLSNNNTNATNAIHNNNNNNSVSKCSSSALIIKPLHTPSSANQILSNGFKQLTLFEEQQLLLQQKLKEVELYSEKVRSTSGCNGIFSRRLDFSSFNLLPKTRLNSYQVKIEDEGNHGNDETRLFILSSLAQSQKSRVACIICEEPMLVFDRYPLVDGSFFLSPKQHSPDCIEVKYEGRAMFLTCVCMRCLDGTSTSRNISCRFCGEKWDGSNLVLGTMYAYDIFAAMPCCIERIKCNKCFKLLLHPQQRLNFYSDYSHCVTCPFCATQDTHFVKPLNYCYIKSLPGRLPAIA
ncbi:headcase protein-like isoform X2 [Glossina fuscipes]|uniref:Headcase protein-like isoform X2 n=1 Tax=Glossina fuscipes TaxID=7396 RepID=A0A8U0WJY9_9MUSC|nr:headcase protein-like isoform X2 [Glossina fuscipes]